jgi:hypothetical protein
MAPPVLTAYEESIAFYYELGLAITAWANVERSLLWIVIACFTKHNHTQASLQFLSIENFRSKLLAADRVFSTKYDGTKHVDNWGALFAKLEKLSSLRNHLVHYHTMGYPNGKPGQRYALIPTLSKTPKFKSKTPQPPPGSLFLRDIVHARYQFNALAFGLEFLVYRVKKYKTQLPASLAQAAGAPTMAQLVRQIRPILSTQP